MTASTLRLASMADVPALRRLIDDSVRGLSAGWYSQEQIDLALEHIFGPDTQLIADGTYFVVDGDEGRLVASGGWSKRRTLYGGDQLKSQADPLLDPTAEPARLRAMFVHPAAIRRGLGRRLFEACRVAALAEGFTSMELAATLPGVPLYEALGFTGTERFAATLGKGQELPLVRMRRDL